MNSDVLDEVKIFFKDELVTRVSLIRIKIFNNGKLQIKAEDFAAKKPGIKILFNTKNDLFKILSTGILNRSNLDINPEIKIQDKEIIINPCLWNVEDFIEIQSLVNNYEIKDKIIATAHINGMKGDLTYVSELTKPLDILLCAKEWITVLFASLNYLLLILFALRNVSNKIEIFFYIPLRLLLLFYVLWLLVYLVNYIVLLFNQQYRELFLSLLFKKNRQQNG
ncbi:MAG: hypothetical protein AB4062_12570 [Crocosphaera sp.]